MIIRGEFIFMSKKKLNIPLSEFINLKEKKPEDMTGCVVLYKNGSLDVATWHSDAYRLGEERGYFKQGCFYTVSYTPSPSPRD